MTLETLSKTLYYKLLLFTQGYEWVPARVEVDIVYGKAFGVLGLPMLCILPRELEKIKGMLLAQGPGH